MTMVVVLAFGVAACGQHAGVHEAGGLVNDGGTGGTGGTDGGTGGTDGGTGGTDGGTGGTDGGTGGTGGTGGGAGGTGGTGGTGGPSVPTGPADRTGITATTITIGLHAPLTGAAPIEPAAFNKGKDLYWKYLHEVKKQTIFGRKVNVVFRDDQYTPTTAVAVCNQMATSERAFLLIGGAGADQINACAEFSEKRGIPYLSPGVQEDSLRARKTYFAVTMSYASQMKPLVQLLQKEHAKKSLDRFGSDGKVKVGYVRPNTPNFNDSDRALKAAVQAAGWQYKVYSVVKEGTSSEARNVAQLAKDDNVDVLVPITAPTFTVQLALNADSGVYKPQWAGVAVSNNINQFLDSVCQRTGKLSTVQDAIWLSPWPGWKQVMGGAYDGDFVAAANRFASDVNTRNKGGDILMALWGISKLIHQALIAAGGDVSRQSFVATMQQMRLKTGFFPDIQYAPGNPFGAKNAHVLLANCDEQGDGDKVQRGAQWVDHPSYPGLRSSF